MSLPRDIVDIEDELADLAINGLHDLINSGWSAEESQDLMVELIDAALPMSKILPGPLGVFLESVDSDIIQAMVRAFLPLLERDPTKIRERAKKALDAGKRAKSARLMARAKRVEERRLK